MELGRALASLLEPPTADHAVIARACGLPAPPAADEHTDALGFQAFPYAAVYLGPEGMLGGDARDRVAGWWRALGADVPAEPDHLGVLLAAQAALADREAAASGKAAMALHAAGHALLWEHLASWMPPYLAMLRRVGGPFYAAWADLVEAVMVAEAERLGPPRALSAHLREAPPYGQPATLDELLATLLAPARVGFTLARDDLRRAADELGLGVRVGERRFVLRSLLVQDAAATLGWLAGEARHQAATCDVSPLATAGWWASRARDTAVTLTRAV